ncbi:MULTISPECIES: IclR family transcriptional regulator [Brevibacterium]|jgi:DNA-binding IclR family transcriptional regulator|uniref:IclR family transcriptional regulator n=1 Tax=Brevibacterium salitolerans TaxID=1403566 RepID=A0ABN2WGS0_9MICO|nr:IclR family transcriptional regulator [Brevibacterium sp.]
MGIQSVDRAMEALEVLAALGEAGVGDVAGRLEVHKSTASRLLSSLSDHGLVEQQVPGGAYRLGFGLVRLASAVTSRMDFSQVGQALCDATAKELHLTSNVAVLDDVFAVNVSQAVGDGLMAPRHYVGLRTPGHATSSGKVLLAWDEAAAQRAAAGELEAHTAYTLVTAGALQRELEYVRQRDWAASNEEWEEHVTAVAIPLRLPSGAVEAALTVTGPVHSLPPESFVQTAERLHELAAASGRWV